MAFNIICQDCYKGQLEQKRWSTKQAARRVQWALAASEDAPIEEKEDDHACNTCEQAFNKMSPEDKNKKTFENIQASFRATAVAAIPADIFWSWLSSQPYNYVETIVKDEDHKKKKEE